MTVLGKCDSCRTRKVKCDEQRPICGSCRTKNRECNYAIMPHLSVFIQETGPQVHPEPAIKLEPAHDTDIPASKSQSGPSQLQCVRNLSKASGRFITLKQAPVTSNNAGPQAGEITALRCRGNRKIKRQRTASCSPQPALLCPETALSAKYGSVFGFDALQLDPLGEWVRYAWKHSREDIALDCASQYTYATMLAFQKRDEESTATVCAARVKALQTLRQAVTTAYTRESKTSLIVTIMLHYAAEHFSELGTFYYLPHLAGVIQLLGSNTAGTPFDEVSQSVLAITCVDEAVESLFRGRASAFEHLSPPQIPVGAHHDLAAAHSGLIWLFAQLPGLACRVRSLHGRQTDQQATYSVAAEACQLYDSQIDSYVKETLQDNRWCVSLESDVVRSPTGVVAEYSSAPAFILGVRYYLYRMLLCPLLQTLKMFDPPCISIGLQMLENEDVASAMAISMSLDYALRPGPSMPITALAMIGAMEISIGAWDRLQRRQESTDTTDYQQAVQMCDWTLREVHALAALWMSCRTDRQRMVRAVAMFAGGPVVENVNARREQSLRNASEQIEV